MEDSAVDDVFSLADVLVSSFEADVVVAVSLLPAEDSVEDESVAAGDVEESWLLELVSEVVDAESDAVDDSVLDGDTDVES